MAIGTGDARNMAKFGGRAYRRRMGHRGSGRKREILHEDKARVAPSSALTVSLSENAPGLYDRDGAPPDGIRNEGRRRRREAVGQSSAVGSSIQTTVNDYSSFDVARNRRCLLLHPVRSVRLARR